MFGVRILGVLCAAGVCCQVTSPNETLHLTTAALADSGTKLPEPPRQVLAYSSVYIKREKTRAAPDLHRAGLAHRVYGENVPSMSGNVIAELPVTDVWVLPWAVPDIAMPPPTLRFSVET